MRLHCAPVATLLALGCALAYAPSSLRHAPHSLLRAPPPKLTLSSPFPSPDLPEHVTPDGAEVTYQQSSWPVRTMVFIDGTWLYYSLHGRREHCPVTRRFGAGWTYSHHVDYNRLPQLISQYINREMRERHHAQRFVEVVRTVVFTSARAGTHPNSARMTMFRAMEAANFEVHMSTTTGVQEKCIDISLAVEMMHYAATPGAYDCAVLLSGDKDFMPAMSRIRQKGKRVALCSMRNCCSHALVEPSSHVRDFDPIWLDDHLDYLIVPNNAAKPAVSASQILPLIKGFLDDSGGVASSRDIGRHLQAIVVEGEDVLTSLKQSHAGLRHFVSSFPDDFGVEDDAPLGWESQESHASSGEFFVSLLAADGSAEQEELLIDAKIGSGSGGSEGGEGEGGEGGGGGEGSGGGLGVEEDLASASAAESAVAVASSSAAARASQRPARQAAGKAHASDRRPPRPQTATAWSTVGRPREGGGIESRMVRSNRYRSNDRTAGHSARGAGVGVSYGGVDEALTASVAEYLQARENGVASSRDVGRHLAGAGLLIELKQRHSGLFNFLQRHDDLFELILPEDTRSLEYEVALVDHPSRMVR